jgi:hypothetical protein
MVVRSDFRVDGDMRFSPVCNESYMDLSVLPETVFFSVISCPVLEGQKFNRRGCGATPLKLI